jgi:chemotaxis protein methyltransferase CheR
MNTTRTDPRKAEPAPAATPAAPAGQGWAEQGGAGQVRVSLAAENLRYLCGIIYNESGIVLDDSKAYLLEARLLPVAREEGESTLDGLCSLVRAAGGHRLRDKVVEALTTNETLFFRDIKPFEALEKVLIPELLKRRESVRKLRFWCAACSTGQEPYSLAMLWSEMAVPGWQIDILGTDLAEAVLERARAGRFQQIEVNRGLPAKYLVKYFHRDGLTWEIRPEIRGMVQWRKFNLKDSMDGLPAFDVVLCRNVLIYFDLQTKRRILANIRKVLRPEGYLGLGSSETTLNVDDAYIRRQVGPAIFYQAPGPGA